MLPAGLPVSPHFTLHALAPGVLAALATDGGALIANAGLVHLGDRVLVFDTGLTPSAGEHLHAAARALAGPAPLVVVNSHYHNDHTWGNQAFGPDCPLLATRQTRALLLTEGRAEYDYYRAHSAEQLHRLQQQYDAAAPEARPGLALWLGYYAGLVADLPRLAVRLPDLTFETSLTLHGSAGAAATAHLQAYPGGHTPSDTILWLPDHGLVFTADLLFVGCHPYLADGDPDRLLDALRALQATRAATFVPGHGQPGTQHDVQLNIDYVEECLALAQRLARQGPPDEAALTALPIPPAYAHWQLPRFYRANLSFLWRRAAGK